MKYRIDVSPDVQKTIPTLPGNIRQRIRRAIGDLAQNPRPPRSKELDFPLDFAEPRRLRLEEWRIVYAIIEDANLIAVVAVRKRPPYDYTDLAELFADISG
ncbi:MAG: type II toxin-antitoxin system RelE/ParE family toxin [Chloroflexi bacterium]|nr:type II toxin-antitoxin system RelE/ParE family toxin [Chloroflexota bacterium]